MYVFIFMYVLKFGNLPGRRLQDIVSYSLLSMLATIEANKILSVKSRSRDMHAHIVHMYDIKEIA